MKKILLAAFTLLTVPVCGAVLAENGEHEHGTHGDATQLQLNNGERWQTDAPLRTAMENIRGVLEPKLDAIHTDTLDATAYAAMADDIEQEVHYMVRNCKLPPAADAELHKLVALLAQGAQEMRSSREPRPGAVKIVKALTLYGEYFEHNGWRPLAH